MTPEDFVALGQKAQAAVDRALADKVGRRRQAVVDRALASAVDAPGLLEAIRVVIMDPALRPTRKVDRVFALLAAAGLAKAGK